MNAIIDWSLSRSRAVLAGLAVLMVAGIYAYAKIPKESDPDVHIPLMYVNLALEGIQPEDAERLLLRPAEIELKSVEGVKEMRSNAYEGGAYVVLEFDAGFDAKKALDDVREKVDRVKPKLPAEAEEPRVTEINLSLLPVLVVTLSGDVPERSLVRLARALKDSIEGVPAVLEAKLVGNREESVEIIIDPLAAEGYGLSADDVATLLTRSNRLVAAGAMDTGKGRFAVKVPGVFKSVRDVLDMPIKASRDGVVRLLDIAEVRRTFKDPLGFARIDGKPAIALEVSKRTGENVIDTVAAVRAVVEAERQLWPSGVVVRFSQDRSSVIEMMLADLENNMISAILLVMVVIVASMGVRSAGLVGVAVPGSFLMGMLVLWGAGLTVNIVVLFSLILAVGMLVDGAIVLTEYADRRIAEGLPPAEAYAESAKRMVWPITSSIVTATAAFLPLLFWPGVVGEFMKYLPITLVSTMLASLLMAMIFVPTLGSVLRRNERPAARAAAMDEPGSGSLDRIGGVTGAYVRLLAWSLRRPGRVVLASIGVLIGVQVLYGAVGKGVRFFPEVEPDAAVVNVHARGNLSVHERDALVRAVEDHVLALQRERGEFKTVYARTQMLRQTEQAEDVIGTISLEFADWRARRKAQAILDDLRARGATVPGIVVDTQKLEGGPAPGKPIQIQLTSRMPELLDPAAATLRALLDSLPGLRDVEDTRPIPGIDWQLAIDRAEAARFGADLTAVGAVVRLVTNGLKLTTYRPDDAEDEIDILARFPPAYRTLDRLDTLRVQTAAGLVPIAGFVERRAVPRVGEVNKVDGQRVVLVKTDVAPGVLPDDVVRQIRERLPGLGLDQRVTVAFKGEDKEQREAAAFLLKAFVGALFLIAIVLITQFNSFYSTMLILSAVVMSTIGVFLGLIITQEPFGIVMTGIGVVSLAGVVVSNNIILIDTYDILKREEPPFEALLRTGAQRLRPVFLTAVTTVLGLVPMMFGVNIDFIARDVSVGAPSTQWWTDLSNAIFYGLSFATILTLIVTPCALMLRENLRARMARRRSSRTAPVPAG